MRRCLLYSAALGLVALGIAGCGGGDDEETTAAPTTTAEVPAALSKEELIAQGDGICAEVNAAVGTVDTTDSGAASQAVQVSDLYAGMVERLQGLGAPSDDSAGYDEFLAAAEQLAQAESDVQLAAERGEEEALTTVESDASSALASFQSAASAYGFTECAEGPSAPAPGAAGAGSAEEPVEGIEEEEIAPEVEEEVAPEAGGAGATEEGGAGGGATAGGGTEGGGEAGGGESSGGIGPG
jgi:uncharacterized membrane protein YgcG